ncbi:MAG: Methylated-DNA--protein-cysteine methyltransferase [Rickettsia asembonensis]|nr:MAG: Methylated-DNA--protein-cysteine methyltransferase [Rickettsia asembonensis]
MNVPYGETRSYFTQAKLIGRERSYRAVANANGANKFAIIIPCHRIINNNGELGGYGSGLDRKKWLIEHEKQNY